MEWVCLDCGRGVARRKGTDESRAGAGVAHTYIRAMRRSFDGKVIGSSATRLRIVAFAAALVLACIGQLSNSPGAVASAARSAFLVFIDAPPSHYEAVLEQGAEHGLSTGLLSYRLGAGPPDQTFLDIGQGARVDYSLYGPMPASPARVADGRVVAASELADRADSVAADVVPGLMATTLDRAGIPVIFRAGDASDVPQALSAMRRDGVLELEPWAGGASYESLARDSSASSGLTVAVAYGVDASALAGVLADLSRHALTVAVVDPPQTGGSGFVPILLGRPGRTAGALTSDSTRVGGLTVSTDIAATVYRWFGVPVPSGAVATPIETGPRIDASRLVSTSERFSSIGPRRLPAVAATGVAWLLTALLLAAVARRRGFAFACRTAAPAILIFPAVLVVDAALSPSFAVEVAGVAAVDMAAAAALVFLFRGYGATASAASLTVFAVFAALAFGPDLIDRALLGPNPTYGARFYGLGNELEGLVSASLILGAGSLLTVRRTRHASAAFVGVGIVGAVLIGFAGLGADFGGAATVGAGAFVAAWLSFRAGGTALWGTLPAAAVGAVTGFVSARASDLLSGTGGHLAATGAGHESVSEMLRRRVTLNLESLLDVPTAVALGLIAFGLCVVVVRGAGRFSERRPAMSPAGAAFAGTVAAACVGFVVNDSGSIVFIGAGACALFFAAFARFTGDRRHEIVSGPNRPKGYSSCMRGDPCG